MAASILRVCSSAPMTATFTFSPVLDCFSVVSNLMAHRRFCPFSLGTYMIVFRGNQPIGFRSLRFVTCDTETQGPPGGKSSHGVTVKVVRAQHPFRLANAKDCS